VLSIIYSQHILREFFYHLLDFSNSLLAVNKRQGSKGAGEQGSRGAGEQRGERNKRSPFPHKHFHFILKKYGYDTF
jgi:hypothetical protein